MRCISYILHGIMCLFSLFPKEAVYSAPLCIGFSQLESQQRYKRDFPPPFLSLPSFDWQPRFKGPVRLDHLAPFHAGDLNFYRIAGSAERAKEILK